MSFFDELGKFKNNIALIDVDGNSYNYDMLLEKSLEFAGKIKNESKKLIFICCANDFKSISAYLGAILSGNSAVLLDPNIKQDLLEHLIQLYRPDYIWGPQEYDGKIVYRLDGYNLTGFDICRDFEIYPALSILLSTSGSTGSPKMVRLTAANLEANASSIARYLKLDEKERPVTSLPMHYSYGLSVINSHLRVGATLILTNDSIVTRPFWNQFRQHEATSFAGVPYMYEMLRRFKFFEMNLPSLKTMTQAGGKLTPKFAREFAEFAHGNNIDFYIMYGQTEATARISYLPPERCLEKYASIGIAIPDGKLQIYDGGKEITEPQKNGELVYTGPNVMLGYAESERDLEKGDELNGVLMTGDLAYFDDDHYYYISGRMKRFLKIYGNRINLDEIEHFVKGSGYEAVCGGIDDNLFIATVNRGKADEIKKLVIQKYGFHHSVVNVVEVTEIPKNTSGKIQYEEIFKKWIVK